MSYVCPTWSKLIHVKKVAHNLIKHGSIYVTLEITFIRTAGVRSIERNTIFNKVKWHTFYGMHHHEDRLQELYPMYPNLAGTVFMSRGMQEQ